MNRLTSKPLIVAFATDDVLFTDGPTGVRAFDASKLVVTSMIGSLAALSSINNSNWSGTALAIGNGGTGATTASGARVSLLPSYAGNGGKILALNAGATDTEWIAAGGGTVTSVSVVTANGISGTVANASTTPAITLSLGAIDPTSIGATTPGTGKFTTLAANSNILSSGGVVGYSSGTTVYTIGSGGYNGPVGGSTPAAGSFTTLSASDNLILSGVGKYILGDFSSAVANRPAFKTTTINGNTFLSVVPDGTGALTGLNLFGLSDVTTNAFRLGLTADSTQAGIINVLAQGTATIRPLRLQVQSTTICDISTTGLAVTGIVSASVADKITLSGVAATDQYFLAQNYTNADGTESVTTAARASWRFRMRNATSVEASIDYRAAAAAASAWSSIATFSSTGLSVTGALTATAANTAYHDLNATSGARLQLFGGSHAIFPKHAYLDADNIYFRTSAGSTVGQFSSTGLAVTGGITASATISATSTNPRIEWYDNGGAADAKRWDFLASAGVGSFRLVNDANSSALTWLQVNRTGISSAAMTMTGTLTVTGVTTISGTSGNVFLVGTSTGDSNYRARIDGGSGASWRMDTSADSTVIGFFRSGSNVGTISVTSTATTYATSSDSRLKTNIRDYDSGSILDLLKPRIFDWKTGQKDSIGFVAQELHAVYPQAVVKGDDGEEITQQWGVDFSKLVPVLVAELKALRARVAALESTNA